jgi:lipopolysaccharide/colanic/teichoic acid biosynthesis glycosyltransferase
MSKQGRAGYPFLKWFTDKCISLTLLALFSPIFTIVLLGMGISMLLRPQDRGLLFYRERRISKGREFDVLKFRVLREDVLARMHRENKHARLYEKDTSNLTWAGHYLIKKWYLDELPQLWNILKGDMSLVGPRPWPVHMVQAQVARGVTYRNHIHAGWTGPAQLQKGQPTGGRSEQLDQEYLHRCQTWPSWRLLRYDLGVLYETLQVMVQGQGLKY